MKIPLLPFSYLAYLIFWLAPSSHLVAQEYKPKNAFLVMMNIPEFEQKEENVTMSNETNNDFRTRLSLNACIGYGKNSKNMIWAVGMGFGFSKAYDNRFNTNMYTNQQEYRLYPFLLVQYHFPLSRVVSISPYFTIQAGYSWNRGGQHTVNSNLKGSGFFASTSVSPLCITFTTKGKNSFFVSARQVGGGYVYKKIADNATTGNTTEIQKKASVGADLMAFGLGFQKFF